MTLLGIEILGTLAVTSAEFIDAIGVESEAYRHPWRSRDSHRRSLPRIAVALERIVEELRRDVKGQQRVHRMIEHLSHQGLATRNATTKRWRLTAHGYARRRKLQKNFCFAVPTYHCVPAPRTVIVAFDVPERDRKKRNWLRAALCMLGLKPLQKSVWVGKVMLPQEFFEDLEALGLSDCVQVLGVTVSGTLESVCM